MTSWWPPACSSNVGWHSHILQCSRHNMQQSNHHKTMVVVRFVQVLINPWGTNLTHIAVVFLCCKAVLWFSPRWLSPCQCSWGVAQQPDCQHAARSDCILVGYAGSWTSVGCNGVTLYVYPRWGCFLAIIYLLILTPSHSSKLDCVMNSFSSLICVYHAFHFFLSFAIDMHFTQGWHAFLHMFASRQTPVLYLFKSVVERLYSLAIH